MDLSKLKEPFPPEDVEWRIGRAGKSGSKIWAKVLAYITNRAIMDRLDAVCGPDKWHNEYKAGPSGGVICGISIRIGDDWVTKWDGAENTEIESVKGGLSDSMKRAGVQWGIGRYLYGLDEDFADISDAKKPGYRYARSKIGNDYATFFWKPPQLPKWAVPDGTKTQGNNPPSSDKDLAKELSDKFRAHLGPSFSPETEDMLVQKLSKGTHPDAKSLFANSEHVAYMARNWDTVKQNLQE